MKMLMVLVCVALALGLVVRTSARTWHVPDECLTIQAGIDSATSGDTVLVADGTYTGEGNRDLDFGGDTIVVMSENGPDVTIINCQGDSLDPHRGFYFHSGEDSGSVVQGFTIKNGYVSSGGGGIACVYGASPTIVGNKITGNTAGDGGGIDCYYGASPTIVGNMIIENTAEYGGGISCVLPIWTKEEAPLTTLCPLIFNLQSKPQIVIHNIVGNTIAGNTATEYGGGIRCFAYSPTIVGNTITENTAMYEGGGIWCYKYSYPTVLNSILWGDSAGIGQEIYVGFSSSIGVSYSDVEGGWPGSLDCDPLFCYLDTGNYYLAENSCCVGAGQGGVDIGALGVGCDSVSISFGSRQPGLPGEFKLDQNYPNPFNPTTEIKYALPVNCQVRLEIYNLLGQRVITLVDEPQQAGYRSVRWDGSSFASGIYFYRLQAGDFVETKRMILLK